MKVTELNEELACEIKETSLFLIRAINFYREKHRITHSKIADQMSISQGTVSKILSEKNIDQKDNKYGNLSVSEARKICKAMGATLGVVLSEYEQQFAQYSTDYAKKLLRNIRWPSGVIVSQNSAVIFPDRSRLYTLHVCFLRMIA